MVLISSLVFASTLALASNSQSIYLAKFTDAQQEIKTKISFHHALLASESNGLLLELNEQEVILLKSKGITLTPATHQWQEKLNNIKNNSQKTNNQNSGIPGFSCYETVEETFFEADKLVTQYPDLTQWIDIGDSWQKQNGGDGYDLKVLKIGNKELIDPPILFIQSAMHAREYTTAALTLDFAKTLLNNFESDPDINWILNRHQIHILFQTNPDGRKLAESGIDQRKNNNENHCHVLKVGVDLNRNFSFGWNTVSGGSSGNECDITYRGTAPGSEPEVSAIENYVRSIYPDVRGDKDTDAAPVDTKGLYLDIHSYSELILWPFGHTETIAPNNKGLQALGRKLAYFNGYEPYQSVGLYPTDGTSDNLAYGELGIAHITFELGTAFFQQCSTYENKIKPDNLKALIYAAKVVEAPYLMTSGPDITELKVTQVDRMSLIVEATATDTRFSNKLGIEPTQNIKSVSYSINEYPNAHNTQLAQFTDNDADSSVEQISVELFDSDASVIYFQAIDENNQAGPVSALKLEGKTPSATASISCTGAFCQFETTEKDDDFSYYWYLEDGRAALGQTAEFILASLGEHKLIHRVENNIWGYIGETTININITELIKPNVQFTTSCTEKTCQFDASATTDIDSATLTYAWDFGDSNNSDSITPEHRYENTGSYSVMLTVTDEHNQTSTISKEVTVSEAVIPEPTSEPEEKQSSGGSLFYLIFVLFGIRKIRI
ncbi:hypothetical protein CJF42_21850 [Pseudoalteromonas sp. NBT06-2]|uniref:M14 family zinc carboxypeptidase n=1 Tax=Pseudoalteromonas sp. NBT06-2 TaxID=2025950 RepID=UPI000BA667CB|nr:M14 family zinc carboxypeptidase [Pseudoalteromonas sp. NBT06-2]PAJ72319.1 hypothetical protein CJF42_21850 [Pseudoalteromonas sp. NBT06-2]